MNFKFFDREEKYDGSQLTSLRNYLKHQIMGDSIVAWIGPCDVHIDHMVDGEDVLAGARICGDKMLHFIVEKFDCSLFAAVGLQRLLASLCKDAIQRTASEKALAARLRREGDDLYCDNGKLSISIASVSPVNALIHFAVNVINSGTPVQTISLMELGVDPKRLAQELMTSFCHEVLTMQQATQKVHWVR